MPEAGSPREPARPIPISPPDIAPSPPNDMARSPPNIPTSPWEIWVDTGGTFTDCIGRDPTGGLHRAKVLSTSTLRGSVRAHPDPQMLLIDALWTVNDALLIGFAFRSLGDPADSGVVTEFDGARGVLRLDQPIAPQPRGSRFELRSPDEAPILAARMITGVGSAEPLPPMKVRLATTRATNALLERKGSDVAFFVTRGFADVLRIGTQQRPDLFALEIIPRAQLYTRVIEVTERVACDGTVLRELDEAATLAGARAALDAGVRVAAVSLLHAYRNDVHERRVEALLREAGFAHVSISSALAPEIGHLHRSETAVVNAYLAPLLTDYVEGVEEALTESGPDQPPSLHLMTSTGGLARPADFHAKDALLSGPAGGVVGAARTGEGSGFSRVIAFDMGGTSTDVARFDGDFEYVWRHGVGDVELLAPALAIESVAAGGGSVCSLVAGGLSVGPRSAGAQPGPACYGAGGPLTITDCNLLLGRIDPERFGVPVSLQPAQDQLELLRASISESTGEHPAGEPLLAGLIDIADERMADAIRRISLRRGYDPAEYALVVFGGAGAQHGCGVAMRLGIKRQIIPADAGLLSAWGLGHARVERVAQKLLLCPLGSDPRWLEAELDLLATLASEAVQREGIAADQVVVRRRIANLRLVGQDSTIPVELDADTSPARAFAQRYHAEYGHQPERRSIEVESIRVIADGGAPAALAAPARAPSHPANQHLVTRTWIDGGWREVPCIPREALVPGEPFVGPCLITDPHTTIVVTADWLGTLDDAGAIILSLNDARAHDPSSHGADANPEIGRLQPPAPPDTPHAVREQLFTSRFEALVGEMGEQLRRTSLSTNVKERLDFSCALLDSRGELIANAPHIPVHLGALGLCVRRVAAEVPLRPGDVVVTNHPAYGGSHLPDVTVITPVFTPDGTLIGYVASRAHHAEIGGSRPGSMPPDARALADEGVVIPPIKLIEGGQPRWSLLVDLLASGPHPSRAADDNLADVKAQLAANHRGALLLRQLVGIHGATIVGDQMEALSARSERRLRAALRRLGDGTYTARERLDDGNQLVARITIEEGRATFDFAGTSPTHPGNLNATPAIVRSAVIYLLRLLIDEPLPLNEGLLRPVDIRLPRSLLNPVFRGSPDQMAAVVGGNTEISQRLVDTLLKALALAACSQGTMNNVLWGNQRFGYYETLAGGTGAGPDFDGCDAVHSHMTNTRITDTEILEHRYPVRVERFAVRMDSGGAGRHRGGDGVVREVTFLEPVSVSVLTQHRREGPYGLEGGESGLPGRQRLFRAGGEVIELGSVDGCEVSAGDRLVVETPGGGGWGLTADDG